MEGSEWRIKKEFKDHEVFLVGNPRQFVVEQGAVYCVRESAQEGVHPCTGCPYWQNGCESEEAEIQTNWVPHPRRGFGYEEESFLLLAFRGEFTREDVPKEHWDNPYSNLAYKHPDNLHFILTPLGSKLWTVKGMIRYYGTVQEFEESPLVEWFEVVEVYEPKHNLLSLDYSAIEPRITTILSQEPEWVRVFEGTPKVVANQVEISVIL